MAEMQNIQWFPGHMAKTRRKIKESLSLVDAVAELVDARIPMSSRNPEMKEIAGQKPRLLLLNKSDLADARISQEWMTYFRNDGAMALAVDCQSRKGLSQVLPSIRTLLADKLADYQKKGMVGRKLRVLVAGIPNVGKSSFINCMAKGSRAKVEDRPGVTRGNQWFVIDKTVELLDTPGVLWPKFDDPAIGEKLAFTGAVKDTVLDVETLALRLIEVLGDIYPHLLQQRYKLEHVEGLTPLEILRAIGKRRGMLISGGEIDAERVAVMLLDEYRSGMIGRMTLERPEGGG